MSAANDIRAGGAWVELSVKNLIGDGLDVAGSQLEAFGAEVGQIGAALGQVGLDILTPLIDAATHVAELGSEVADISEQLGVSTTGFQTLTYAIETAGGTSDDLAAAVKKSQKAISDAGHGAAGATAALAAVGLTFQDLAGLAPDEQFRRVALAVGAIQNPALRTSAALALMGEAGLKVLPAFTKGAQALREMEMRGEGLGHVMSPEEIAAADDFGDALGDLRKTFSGIERAVGSAVIPTLSKLTKAVAPLVTMVTKLIDANQAIIVGLLATGAALLVVGVVVGALASAVIAVGAAAPLFVGGMAAIGAAATAVIAGVGGALAFVASPAGLAVIAVVGLFTAIIYWSGAGTAALKAASAGFTNLQSTAATAMAGINAAMAANDPQLAWKISAAGMIKTFGQFAEFVEHRWYAVRDWFYKTAFDMQMGLASIFVDIGAGIESAWISTVDLLGGVWDGFVFAIRNSFNDVVRFMEGVNITINEKLGKIDAQEASRQREQLAKDYGAVGRESRDASRQTALDQVEARRQAQQRLIGNTIRQADKDRAEATRRQGVATGAGIAMADWAMRQFVAEAERKKPPEAGGPPAPPAPEPPPVESVAIGAVGTFNAFQARQLFGGGDAAERTAAATEAVQKQTTENALAKAFREGSEQANVYQ